MKSLRVFVRFFSSLMKPGAAFVTLRANREEHFLSSFYPCFAACQDPGRCWFRFSHDLCFEIHWTAGFRSGNWEFCRCRPVTIYLRQNWHISNISTALAIGDFVRITRLTSSCYRASTGEWKQPSIVQEHIARP